MPATGLVIKSEGSTYFTYMLDNAVLDYELDKIHQDLNT